MKQLLIFLMFSFFVITNLYSQKLIPETEVIFQTRNGSPSNLTTFEVNPISFEGLTTISYRFNDDNCNVYVEGTGTSVTLKGNVMCPYSGLEYIFYGQSPFGGSSCDGNSEYKPFSNALYEIKIKLDGIEKFKFVLDTRHNSLPNGCVTHCGGNDISIIYFINSNTVKAAPGYWQGTGTTKDIYNGRYYTWWEIKNNCSISLSKFNEQYLPILLAPEEQNSSPYLEWEKATSSDAAQLFYAYYLQRSVNFGSFVTIYTSNDIDETSYLDYEIFYDPNQTGTIIQYRVVADYWTKLDISNYQTINTDYWYLMKRSVELQSRDYNLSHNYPNPFNPITKINYKIPEEGFASIIVYDALGREMSKLIDLYMQPGEYSVDFDANGLNSGVYFYTLRINNYTETKQMILLK